MLPFPSQFLSENGGEIDAMRDNGRYKKQGGDYRIKTFRNSEEYVIYLFQILKHIDYFWGI